MSQLQGTMAQSELVRSVSRDRIDSGDRVSYRDLSLTEVPDGRDARALGSGRSDLCRRYSTFYELRCGLLSQSGG